MRRRPGRRGEKERERESERKRRKRTGIRGGRGRNKWSFGRREWYVKTRDQEGRMRNERRSRGGLDAELRMRWMRRVTHGPRHSGKKEGICGGVREEEENKVGDDLHWIEGL